MNAPSVKSDTSTHSAYRRAVSAPAATIWKLRRSIPVATITLSASTIFGNSPASARIASLTLTLGGTSFGPYVPCVSPELITSSSMASRTRVSAFRPPSPAVDARSSKSWKNDGHRCGYSRPTSRAHTCASLFWMKKGTGGVVAGLVDSWTHDATCDRSAAASCSDSDA